MNQMVVVNFYKKHETTWDELQMLALDTIAKFEEEVDDIEIGSLTVEQQYEDYRAACMQGLKTFILQVVNEWAQEHILMYNDSFYKRFEVFEMDGILNSYQYPNLYRNTKELFKLFKDEKVQISLMILISSTKHLQMMLCVMFQVLSLKLKKLMRIMIF
jgi:hypothetical protein